MSRSTGRALPPVHRARTSGGGVVDLTKEEPDFDAPNYGVDPSTPALTMPTPRRRNNNSAARPGGEPSRKRRGSATSSSRPGKARRKEPFQDDLSSLFGDDAPTDSREHDHSDSIDLSNATEVPQELMAPRVDNRVKLGHLFCSECLHSALHIDSMKRTCPVCRTKVDLKDKKGKNTKSYYHLELKVLTATKKGKRRAS
ncbi:hypothetical protein F4775DRAFT_37856 [Biscogniauxia sp. FL1348]|nr:hypothetical protein F4775DRAFT_37856 [Biscogniauxia sp. FL1348]